MICAAVAVAMFFAFEGIFALEGRMVLNHLSQTYIPFEYPEGAEPRICYDTGVTEQLTYDGPTNQVVTVGSQVQLICSFL
ncbi:MAG: hypothetical protein AAGC55_09340, partial [Myxococcota bacterium]